MVHNRFLVRPILGSVSLERNIGIDWTELAVNDSEEVAVCFGRRSKS